MAAGRIVELASSALAALVMSSIELTGAVNCAAQMSPRSKTPVRVTMTPVSTALFLMATMPVFGTRMDALQV